MSNTFLGIFIGAIISCLAWWVSESTINTLRENTTPVYVDVKPTINVDKELVEKIAYDAITEMHPEIKQYIVPVPSPKPRPNNELRRYQNIKKATPIEKKE